MEPIGSQLVFNNGVCIEWILATIFSQFKVIHSTIITLPMSCNILLGMATSYQNSTAWQQTGYLVIPKTETTMELLSYQDPTGGGDVYLNVICLVIGS